MALAVLTMTATWVGGGFINGTAEAVFGRESGLVWAQAPWGYALSLMLGGLFFARRMRRSGYTTFIDLFSEKYGRNVSGGFSLVALVAEVFWSAAILAALGTTLTTVIGLDYRVAVILSAVVAVSYTLMGGLWAVAYTDALQLFLILGGLGLAVPFVVESAGGLTTMLENYRGIFGTSAALVPPASAWSGGEEWGYRGWLWADMALLLIFGGIPWQVYFQRVLACKDDRMAVRFSVLAGFGCILCAMPPLLLGAAGATVDWSSTSVGVAPEPVLALPYILRYLTPPWIAVLGLAAIAAAVMSSVDSSVLSASSLFTWNVFLPFSGPLSDKSGRLVLRVSAVVVGFGAVMLALVVKSVYILWFLCSDLVYVILFPQLVMALFCRRVTKTGAVAGALIGLVLRLGGGEPFLGIPALIPFPLTQPDGSTHFPFRTFAMLCSLAVIWIVSRVSREKAALAER